MSDLIKTGVVVMIFTVIGITVWSALAPTVFSNTESAVATGGTLENLSTGAKSGFNLVMLIYGFLGVGLVIGSMMILYATAKGGR
jgi:hypothetical protein